MARQFKVILMNILGVREHIVNCANRESALLIAQAIFPEMRVIEVSEK